MLNFVLAKYALNGTFIGFDPLSNQFQVYLELDHGYFSNFTHSSAHGMSRWRRPIFVQEPTTTTPVL